ncbi:hypothetical protein DCC79_07350 [bacterium]|nr:MAG: hypothetical protein DCC79_07350 [bacterium]
MRPHVTAAGPRARLLRRPTGATGAVVGLCAALPLLAGCDRAARPPDAPPPTAAPVALAPEAYARLVGAFYTGVTAYRVGDNDRARARLAEAAEIAPGEPAVWADRALADLRAGDREAALAAVAEARALAPESSTVALVAALVSGRLGETDQALALLRESVTLDGANLRARYALADELGRGAVAGDTAHDAEIAAQLEAILAADPGNLVVLIERARQGAKAGDAAVVARMLDALVWESAVWPADARAKLEEARAADPTNAKTMGLKLAQLNNLVVTTPGYQQSLARLTSAVGDVAEPIEVFLRLPPPAATPAEADLALSFAPPAAAAAGDLVPAAPLADCPSAWPPAAIRVDWDNDQRLDTVCAAGGLRVWRAGEGEGAPDVDATAGVEPGVAARAYSGVWAVDIDLEGDLDLVLSLAGDAPDRTPVVLRNNGDGTWTALASPFGDVAAIADLRWADLDGDTDPDVALVDAGGAVRVFDNERAGQYADVGPTDVRAAALAVADADADGRLDLVTLGTDGAVVRHAWDGTPGGWSSADLVRWTAPPADGSARLWWADLDNNGALDLVASAAGGTAAWLVGSDGGFAPLPAVLPAGVVAVGDADGDGRVDLGAAAGGGTAAVALNQGGERDYHHQVVRPRALREGDQRNNAFGIGGDAMIRAGLVAQVQPITGPAVHFGLGTSEASNVVRIRWPNGIAQAEFDQPADATVVAEQRLKGSCPWLFAHDGEAVRFVTDVLWKSPIGLRLNAQTTAGVVQTRDWVNVRGDQLSVRDGQYDLRITAELWETHYFDHVALMVVDHPAGTEVRVDERFAVPPPPLEVRVTGPSRPIARAVDDAGRDVTDRVVARDGVYLDTFARGAYQGIAADHHVEVALPEGTADGDVLVASGWVYPTDSSVNVAISQGVHEAPRDLSLEVPDGRGGWTVARPHLGFPAGKHKTMLIDLAGLYGGAAADGPRRLRLRTNMEVYWDSLAVATPLPDAELRRRTLPAASADLRYRGFSYTNYTDGTGSRTEPEVPDYDRLSGPGQMWPDLVGFYTRFGDVRPLLADVDDRYVILNAGDEIALRFDAPAAPPAGWVRDFVFVSDGWEKDGDLNTSYSKTVHPLPSHDRPAYTEPWNDGPVGPLADDPVYQAHAQDWVDYHTRHVTPERFRRGVWP